jgi:CitMHS family citrate-Mg2+:H+ or citrate-Ca2+:H+ symporter
MIRASASLHIPVTTIFNPLIPVQLAGIGFIFSFSWWLGKREARRLGFVALEFAEPARALRRPKRFWINLLLTVAIITGMTAFKLEPVAVFMAGVVLALQINYPDLEMQKERISAHAQAALMMAGILFAAGAFTGIMKDSGMLDAMAKSAVGLAPPGAGRHLPFITVLAQTAAKFGVPPVQMAQAAMLGMHTTGFPVSPLTPAPFLLVGLAGIEFREHQKFTLPFLLGATLWMTLAAIVIGIFPV